MAASVAELEARIDELEHPPQIETLLAARVRELEQKLDEPQRMVRCPRCGERRAPEAMDDHHGLHALTDDVRLTDERFPTAVSGVDDELERHQHLDKLFGQAETLMLTSDVLPQPRRKFVRIAAQSGTSDDLDGIDVKNVKDGFAFLATADAGDTITLTHQNSGGSSGERLTTNTAASVVLTPGVYALIWYDSTADSTNPWHVVVLGANEHAESHTIISHSTNPQFSDVFSFVSSTDSKTISGGTFNLPAAPFGLIVITGEGGVDDTLDDILTNGGSETLVSGTTILLTNASGDAITIDHSLKITLSTGADVVLDDIGIDLICLYAANNTQWKEKWRSPSLMPTASTSVSGFVELATAAETTTSTSTTRAITPGGFSDSIYGIRYFALQIFPPATDTATGDTKAFFHIPPGLTGMDLMYVHAEVVTAGTTGTLDIQLAKNGSTDMLSTKLTVDSTETGSDTAATAAVIKSDGSEAVVTNDTIEIDIDSVHTTEAKGLVVTLGFRIP